MQGGAGRCRAVQGGAGQCRAVQGGAGRCRAVQGGVGCLGMLRLPRDLRAPRLRLKLEMLRRRSEQPSLLLCRALQCLRHLRVETCAEAPFDLFADASLKLAARHRQCRSELLEKDWVF